jgi:hypothetical protein
MSSANRLDENKEPQKEVEIPKKEIPSQFSKAKIFLKKHWLVLLVLLSIIASYFGLTAIKNSLIQDSGNQTDFKNPPSPDLAKENKAKEDAQKKTDRVGAADQANNQVNETKQIEKDTTDYVRYTVSDAYKKTLPIEVKKVEKPKKDTVKKVEKTAVTAIKTKKNKQVFIVKSEREKIKNRAIETKMSSEIDGFNTVVVLPKNSTESVFNKGYTPPKHYFKAAIYGNQTVRSGSQVRIRLLESLIIDEQAIPANSLCSGIAILGSNRVAIALTSVQVHGQQIGFKSMIFDKDLLPGIAFTNESEIQQNIRQQRNSGIDQASNNAINAIPQIGGMAGAALSTGVGVVNGISKSIRYGGVQRHIGEITLEEGYKVFIQ